MKQDRFSFKIHLYFAHKQIYYFAAAIQDDEKEEITAPDSLSDSSYGLFNLSILSFPQKTKNTVCLGFELLFSSLSVMFSNETKCWNMILESCTY